MCEVIAGRETNSLQFAISHKLNVQVPPTGADIGRAFLPTVTTDDGRETKRPIADLNVVKLALPGRLDGILLIEKQVDALARRSWEEEEKRLRAGEKKVEEVKQKWRV